MKETAQPKGGTWSTSMLAIHVAAIRSGAASVRIAVEDVIGQGVSVSEHLISILMDEQSPGEYLSYRALRGEMKLIGLPDTATNCLVWMMHTDGTLQKRVEGGASFWRYAL